MFFIAIGRSFTKCGGNSRSEVCFIADLFAADPNRLARFEVEARSVASLNHPNIAGIYGTHEHEGARFLAMEFIEGEDLAERISRGPVARDEALSIAIQIAKGLEAAHDGGVIHRDLKPANVKLTPDGDVKVLDFGLAKALVGDRPELDDSMSPTVTKDATGAGVVLGTALATGDLGNWSHFLIALSAGTFVYVALCEIMPRELQARRGASRLAQVTANVAHASAR